MTVHEQMPEVLGIAENVAPELQHARHVLRLRRDEAGRLFDDVVELQLQPRMLAIRAEGFGLGLVRVEDRKHVADLAAGVPRQLFKPANGDREGRIEWRHCAFPRLKRRLGGRRPYTPIPLMLNDRKASGRKKAREGDAHQRNVIPVRPPARENGAKTRPRHRKIQQYAGKPQWWRQKVKNRHAFRHFLNAPGK